MYTHHVKRLGYNLHANVHHSCHVMFRTIIRHRSSANFKLIYKSSSSFPLVNPLQLNRPVLLKSSGSPYSPRAFRQSGVVLLHSCLENRDMWCVVGPSTCRSPCILSGQFADATHVSLNASSNSRWTFSTSGRVVSRSWQPFLIVPRI